MPHTAMRTVEPKILYFGTPVALVSSLNEDGTTNLAPMSSFWALGWTMMLGCLNAAKRPRTSRATPNASSTYPRRTCGARSKSWRR